MTNLTTEIIKTLSATIEIPSVYNRDFVERLIEEDQRQHPASWQEWDFKAKVDEFVAAIKMAIKEEETAVERVLLYCF